MASSFHCRRKKYESSSSSSSDDEIEELIVLEESESAHKKRDYIDRGTSLGHQQLWHDYFSESPTYKDDKFRRRFRMRRNLFVRIQHAVEAHDSFFQQKRNAAGKMGLTSLQKITAAIRMLAYGVTGDFMDEYVRIGESTSVLSMKRFLKAVINVFGEEYLRRPNSHDIARLLAIGEQRGFPGMLGSIDCMHWKWKNCPSSWKGMYSGHVHEPTIILEAVASHDLWIWHAFFGLPGSHNDINTLERSSIFSKLVNGRTPPVNYSINGHTYTIGYYLEDGIYPTWATFVKTIGLPQTNKTRYFAMCQEAARKDVERAFGVLQARFAIVRGPARYFHVNTLNTIMMGCIILHNMIVEDERHLHMTTDISSIYKQIKESPPSPQISHDMTPEFKEFIKIHHSIRSKDVHSQLQADLVEHLWNIHSQS